jgi:hypothetical protein
MTFSARKPVTNTYNSSNIATLITCNLTITDSFTLRFEQTMFQIEKLLKNMSISGLIKASFHQYKLYHKIKLTTEALLIQNTPNAGGNSIESEVLSFEILKKSFNAKLLKTEMEIKYFPNGGSITDYVCKIFDSVIGVSVTRAMKYRDQMTAEDASYLLRKKLKGINQSSKNSLVKWSKQILHVWVQTNYDEVIVEEAWNQIDSSLKTNTIVLITIAKNSNEMFVNRSKKSNKKS